MHRKLIAGLFLALALTAAIAATAHRGRTGETPADAARYLAALADACYVEQANIDLALEPAVVFANRDAVADTASTVAGRLDRFVAEMARVTPPSSLADWHRRSLAYVRRDATEIHTLARRVRQADTPPAFDAVVDANDQLEQRMAPAKNAGRAAYEQLPTRLRRSLDGACPIFTFQQ